MADSIVSGKRIKDLTAATQATLQMRIAVDNNAFAEAQHITIGQLAGLIGSNTTGYNPIGVTPGLLNLQVSSDILTASPYANKKSTDPTFPYLYLSTEIPTFTNRVTLDGAFYANTIGSLDPLCSILLQYSQITQSIAIYDKFYKAQSFLQDGEYIICAGNITDSKPIPVRIGHAYKDDYISIDCETEEFIINMSTVILNKHTGGKFLYLNNDKQIVTQDLPTAMTQYWQQTGTTLKVLSPITAGTSLKVQSTSNLATITVMSNDTYLTTTIEPGMLEIQHDKIDSYKDNIINENGLFLTTIIAETGDTYRSVFWHTIKDNRYVTILDASYNDIAGMPFYIYASDIYLPMGTVDKWLGIDINNKIVYHNTPTQYWEQTGSTHKILSPLTAGASLNIQTSDATGSPTINVINSYRYGTGIQITAGTIGIFANGTDVGGWFTSMVAPISGENTSYYNGILKGLDLYSHNVYTPAVGDGMSISFYSNIIGTADILYSSIINKITNIGGSTLGSELEFYTRLAGTYSKGMGLTGGILTLTTKLNTPAINISSLTANSWIKLDANKNIISTTAPTGDTIWQRIDSTFGYYNVTPVANTDSLKLYNTVYFLHPTDTNPMVDIGYSYIRITAKSTCPDLSFDRLGSGTNNNTKASDVLGRIRYSGLYDPNWYDSVILYATAINNFSAINCGVKFGIDTVADGSITSYNRFLITESGGVTINEQGFAVAFRIEGDNDSNLFRTDGINDRVGIGNGSTVDSKLHITTSLTEGTPVLTLEQVDIDKAFVSYIGAITDTIDTNITTLNGGGEISVPRLSDTFEPGFKLVGYIKITVKGKDCWMPYYEVDPPTYA